MRSNDIYVELVGLAHATVGGDADDETIAMRLRELADRVYPQLGSGFFEVTGTQEELFKIILAIESNDGRLSASSSADLDLWQEMLEKWFVIHDKRVEDNTLKWAQAQVVVAPRIEID